MSTALQLHDSDMGSWAVIRQQAEVLVKTGFLPQSIKTPEQAMAIILTGRELGIGAMAALNTINVIQGKPTVSPQLMLALINRSGQVENIQIDSGKDGATVTIKRKGRSAYTARFGPAEAVAMGLNGKDNYKKQPATMYKWRAVADAARATFADVLLGLYTPDEMGATTDLETGEVIEAEALPVSPYESPNFEPAVYEPEPEPAPQVRRVKVEGAQAQDKQAPQAADATTRSIIALLGFLKWDANTLAGEIYTRFDGLGVSDTDTALALDALSGTQKKVLLQALEGEKAARTGGKK